jgi:hypothetical protein
MAFILISNVFIVCRIQESNESPIQSRVMLLEVGVERFEVIDGHAVIL